MTRVTPDESASLDANVEIRVTHDLGHDHVSDHDRVVHTAIVDRNQTILGCIDLLEKNVQLIRLDAGVHWNTFGPVDDGHDHLVRSSSQQPEWLAS